MPCGRLLHHGGDLAHLGRGVLDARDAVLVCLVLRHRGNRDEVAAVLVIGFDHLREAGLDAMMQHIGQEQRERFVTDDIARTPDRMAQAERRLLAREACHARSRQRFRQRGKLLLLVAAFGERPLELELEIEMVLDDTFVAASDEDEVLDAGLPRLIDHMLDDRPVDDRQHLLGHSLGGGEKARAEPGDREHGFPYTFLLRHRGSEEGEG